METKTSEAKDTKISAFLLSHTKIPDDAIKNFLSAVCDIVAYDLTQKKNFAVIELVLKKLKTDKVFSQATENNAEILGQKMSNDIKKIISGDKNDKSTIYNSWEQSKNLDCHMYEFCMFVSFFLPKTQRDKLQNELLTGYYKKWEFYRKVPLSLEEYLSDDLKKIIDSKDNQRINIEQNNNSSHYEIVRIKDDDNEFNNDNELQKRYITLLKVIRDDIAFGNDEIYKKSKNELLESNNNFVEKMKNIQKMCKQMPGWLRSKFWVDWLDDLNIRDKYITTKNGQVLTYKLCTKNSSGDKITACIDGILKFLDNNDLKHNKIDVSTGKICLMNFLSFFYYGLNLKFFVDVFKLDMRKEDFMILFPLLIGVLQIAGFVYFPFALPMVHFFSAAFGSVFLAFDLLIYREKFVSSEDIIKYNSDLNEFSNFVEQEFENGNITLKKESVGKSQEYDKIIDGYEEKYKNNIRISSGYHEDCQCDCPDNCCECGSCDCPSAEECLCGCLNGAANSRCDGGEVCCMLMCCCLLALGDGLSRY